MDASYLMRTTPTKKASAPHRQQKAADTKSRWTESRLTQPWAEWRAKRKAERAPA